VIPAAGGTREGDRFQGVAGEIAELIRRAKAYDRAAFASLYDLSVTPVYRYLVARLGIAEDAEELTQEVFLAALSGIQGLRAHDQAGLMSWLFCITRNKLADHLRQRYRRPVAVLDDDAQLEDPGPLPDVLAVANDEQAELREALDKLTAEQREVVMCKYVLGYDNEQTASHLGKNANAVNQLHHRALGSLHRLLTKKDKSG